MEAGLLQGGRRLRQPPVDLSGNNQGSVSIIFLIDCYNRQRSRRRLHCLEILTLFRRRGIGGAVPVDGETNPLCGNQIRRWMMAPEAIGSRPAVWACPILVEPYQVIDRLPLIEAST